MKLYYVNRYPNHRDEYMLHVATCSALPNIFNRICLGNYSTPEEAATEAQLHNQKTTLCEACIEKSTNLLQPEPFYKKWFKKR